ncbi:hypothetical protein SSX86_011859 [Deinandra increscens subsp. villosa]|uniref:Meiosis-specific protein ASY3-like coiled-coil domain-containing protein n=1 Tax=Deinandra increscens subsp. villosa TaxID=3103831 RepID=A0AAP0DAQ3_9ASTR
MSGNWSFGSQTRLCSQTRKISIGIMADSSAKMKSQNGKGAVADLQTSENVNMAKGFSTESKHKEREVISPDSGTQNKAPSGSNRAGEMEPGSYFANQMLNLQNRNDNELKSKNNAYQKEKESSYATLQKENEPKKGIADQGTSERGNGGPVTLRMKVQELLETVCSPKEKQSHSETFRMDANSSKPKATTKGNDSLHERKTNSGSLGKISRPLTRSLTAKKPQAQKSIPRKQTPLYQSEQARFEETAFSFLENWSKRPTTDVNNGFKSFKRKEREISGTKVQATGGKKTKASAINISLFENTKRDGEKVKPNTEMKETYYHQSGGNNGSVSYNNVGVAPDGKKTKAVAKSASLFENRSLGSKKDKPNTEMKETYYHQFGGNNGSVSYNNVGVDPDGKKTKAAAKSASLFENRSRDSEKAKPTTEVKDKKHYQFGGNNGSGSYNNVDVESFAKDSLKDNVDPTFELKTATDIHSPISLFQINKENIDVDSPFENSFRTKRSSNSKGFFTKVHKYNTSMDLQDSPVIKPDLEENKGFRSPSKVVGSESSELGGDSPITGTIFQGNVWFIGGNAYGLISIMFSGLHYNFGNKNTHYFIGDEDCKKFDDCSEQDGFAGAVKLFALALKRVQNKIHSTTSKQSAAILLSVSQNIQSQLQNAESKIQTEVGKLTNLGNSERMHVENKYQEQQEQLKHIYEKFKEDVDQHLEKCKNTLEGLEAHQIQVSRMVEKQRVSHKKFLMQTEEEIEKQLNDAHKRLADVHRMAKEKMYKLKFGIAQCLKEGS